MHFFLHFCFSVVIVIIVVNADEYVNEIQGRCQATSKTYPCAKYRLFKSINDFQFGNFNLTSDSSLKFVNIPDVNLSDVPEVGPFTTARQYFPGDTEFIKVFKFFQRQVNKFFLHRGFMFDLPQGIEVIEQDNNSIGEGRAKKEKKHMSLMINMLMLLKLFKVKVLAAFILAGVIFIKKAILMGAFLLPGIIASIKAHCKQSHQQLHVVPYHYEDDHHHYEHEHHDDSGGGYGVPGYGDITRNQLWSRKRNGYY